MSTLSELNKSAREIDFSSFQQSFRAVLKKHPPSVLLVYPVLNLGAPADRVAPYSLYYLHSTLRTLKIPIDIFFWDVGQNDEGQTPHFPAADIYYIHPMFATVERCCQAIQDSDLQNSGALICLGNSDQHQHEMCLGGRKAVQIAQYVMNTYDAIDLVLLGRNHEYSLARLVQNTATGEALQTGLGKCVYRYQNGLAKNSQDHFFKLPSLPKLTIKGPFPQVIRVRSSVGCRAVCSYCIESAANNSSPEFSNWTGMSASRFIEELDSLVQSTGRRFYNIIDSSFEDAEKKGVDRLLELAGGLIERRLNLSLKIHLRSETVTQLSEMEFDKLKQAGVDIVVIGVESGVDEELRLFGKIASAETSRKATEMLDRQGVFFTILGHLMFTPFTDRRMLLQKVSYLHQIDRCWDYMNMSNWLLVYWGSRMHDKLLEMGLAEQDSNPMSYVKYSFSDPVVGKLAEIMDRLKMAVPDIMVLHKLLYDWGNVRARYSNPANSHLDNFKTYFTNTEKEVDLIYEQAGSVYFSLLRMLIDMADRGADKDFMLHSANRHVQPVGGMKLELEKALHDLRNQMEAKQLDTSMVFVDTWFSNVNVFGVGGGRAS